MEGVTATVDYEPGESTNDLFGGNSNWRGPVWFPVNYLFIESLMRWDAGDGRRRSRWSTRPGRASGCGCGTSPVTWPAGWSPSGCRTQTGARPVYGTYDKLRTDPEWRDLLWFHEYFHGDTGAGIGASHQTGWTGLVAHLLCKGGVLDTSSDMVTAR